MWDQARHRITRLICHARRKCSHAVVWTDVLSCPRPCHVDSSQHRGPLIGDSSGQGSFTACIILVQWLPTRVQDVATTPRWILCRAAAGWQCALWARLCMRETWSAALPCSAVVDGLPAHASCHSAVPGGAAAPRLLAVSAPCPEPLVWRDCRPLPCRALAGGPKQAICARCWLTSAATHALQRKHCEPAGRFVGAPARCAGFIHAARVRRAAECGGGVCTEPSHSLCSSLPPLGDRRASCGRHADPHVASSQASVERWQPWASWRPGARSIAAQKGPRAGALTGIRCAWGRYQSLYSFSFGADRVATTCIHRAFPPAHSAEGHRVEFLMGFVLHGVRRIG